MVGNEEVQAGTDTYLLARDDQASIRLTYQHFVLTSRQGWIFHPAVRESLAGITNPRIADVATGTATWPYEVARQYPNASIVGLDISDAQFPPAITRPMNVTLCLLGLEDKVPDQYLAAFDVVHVRLIVATIWQLDKARIVDNVISMLKPGGYLQWDELTHPNCLVVDKDLNVGTTGHRAIERMYIHAPFKRAVEWASTLPEVFEQHGLIDVVGHRPPVNPGTMVMETQLLTWTVNEIIGFSIAQGKEGAEEQLRLANQDIAEMRRDGSFWCYSWLVATGRKPMRACGNASGKKDGCK